MTRDIPERIWWAVETLDVQPADVILEIGCGRGFAIAPICEKLTSGRIIAIDRSAKMTADASNANARHIESGKASIVHCDLLDTDLADRQFDKIFLFNLNVFWMDPFEELRTIRRLLKPDGKFYIFHQPPPGHELSEFLSVFEANLRKSGFVVIDKQQNDNAIVFSGCIIAATS